MRGGLRFAGDRGAKRLLGSYEERSATGKFLRSAFVGVRPKERPVVAL